MERISEITDATIAALMRDYFLWIGLLVLILAFTLYVYFTPQSIDFFTNPEPKKKPADVNVRSEPQEPNTA